MWPRSCCVTTTQMGSLKQEVLVAAKAVMTNVDAACMIVCYPEIASGYTQCVLA